MAKSEDHLRHSLLLYAKLFGHEIPHAEFLRHVLEAGFRKLQATKPGQIEFGGSSKFVEQREQTGGLWPGPGPEPRAPKRSRAQGTGPEARPPVLEAPGRP